MFRGGEATMKIPAKAGIQKDLGLDPRFRGNDRECANDIAPSNIFRRAGAGGFISSPNADPSNPLAPRPPD